MLHRSVLPGHEHWASFLRRLRYVVVDELHTYRGVFGSHAAAVLRRLRRLAARYGSDPVFVLASATVADPATTARRLTGLDVHAVTEDASARPAVSVALWEPPLRPGAAEPTAAPGARTERRTATAEASDLLGDLVLEGVRTLAFVRSRTGAESVAAGARRRLADVDEDLAGRVLAYRGGYLPEDRRVLEEGLRSGRVVGMATTNALELGVDVAGLDAVLVAGWPGTRASFWQQIGRAGRRGTPALGVFVSRDDPLDTYLAHHPEALFGKGVEATVLDPDNVYVLAPHLAAAAQELPLTEADLELFGPVAADVVDLLVQREMLRRRANGWYWTRRDRAVDLTDLRGAGGSVRIVEDVTGRILGTVEASSADSAVHEGAVHVHQGRTYLVDRLDLADSLAVVHLEPDPGYTTHARSDSDVRILGVDGTRTAGPVTVSSGIVEVTSRVTGFLRRRTGTGTVLSEQPLDLPERRLRTRAVWWTLDVDVAEGVLGDVLRLPGPCTPPSTPRSACCPCSRRATAGTSAACPPPCTPTPSCRPSSSTTPSPAGPGSPTAATSGSWSGRPRRGTPSAPARARTAARRACSPPSAATATNPSTRPGRSPSSTCSSVPCRLTGPPPRPAPPPPTWPEHPPDPRGPWPGPVPAGPRARRGHDGRHGDHAGGVDTARQRRRPLGPGDRRRAGAGVARGAAHDDVRARERREVGRRLRPVRATTAVASESTTRSSDSSAAHTPTATTDPLPVSPPAPRRRPLTAPPRPPSPTHGPGPPRRRVRPAAAGRSPRRGPWRPPPPESRPRTRRRHGRPPRPDPPPGDPLDDVEGLPPRRDPGGGAGRVDALDLRHTTRTAPSARARSTTTAGSRSANSAVTDPASRRRPDPAFTPASAPAGRRPGASPAPRRCGAPR